MQKPMFKLLTLLSIMLAFYSIQSAYADRSPSVEQFTEVDIENVKQKEPHAGFNFNEPAKSQIQSKRTPAGIVAKDPKSSTSPYSYLGPFIFLMALPFAIWMVISKKIAKNPDEDKIDYYSKSHQFKPYKTEYQKSDDSDDDIDYPKAS